MVGVGSIASVPRQVKTKIGQGLPVPSRDGPPGPNLVREPPQLLGEDQRLDRVEPFGPPHSVVHVGCSLGVVAEAPDPAGHIGIRARHEPRVAPRPEVLRGVGAEGRGVAQRSHGPAGRRGPVSLGGIFQHPPSPILGQLHEGRHVDRQPVQMDGHDGVHVEGLDHLRVDQVVLVVIGDHRDVAGHHHGLERGVERVGRKRHPGTGR